MWKVFFSVPYDPGFTATVDGEEVPVEMVDGGLMAIPVKEGEHQIEFRYFPKNLLPASFISALTAVGLLIFEIRRKSSKKKSDGANIMPLASLKSSFA